MCNMVSRKTRTKTRKPKFLTFRLELSPETTKQPMEMENPTQPTTPSAFTTTHLHPQLNVFPLQPENLVEDKETTTVAYFFDPAADGGATATLTTLLGAGSSSEDNNTVLPPPTYASYGEDLIRTAMRSKERSDTSEEKWVCYDEVTSCASELRFRMRTSGRLSLKLDYQEIMNAWTDDKGPLYVQLESPQTVPDLLGDDDFFGHDQFSSNELKDGWGSNEGVGLWTVPELNILQGEEWKQAVGVREASVMRYKEKRQNRLFSKRIRYEVRKINAEKRPRMKGRFVKRS